MKGTEAETNVSGPICISKKQVGGGGFGADRFRSLSQRYLQNIYLTPDPFLILHVCLAGGNLQREHDRA